MKSPSAINGAPVPAGPTGDHLRADGVRRRRGAAKRSENAPSSKPVPARRTEGDSQAPSSVIGSSGAALVDRRMSAQLGELTTLGMPVLRSEWRRLFRREPPRLSRDQMMRAIAYRIQENAFGGLPTVVERRLSKLAGEFESEGRIAAPPPPKVKSGARLVREWRSRTHVVSVVDGGFEYEGETFRSLTAIAVKITGAHWSGPRFFGLVRRTGVKGVDADEVGLRPDVQNCAEESVDA